MVELIAKGALILFTVLEVVRALQFIVGLEDIYPILGQPLWWTCSVRRENIHQYLAYHWEFQNATINFDNVGIVNFGNGTIYISEVKYINIGLYTCAATDGDKSIKSQAWLGQSYVPNNIDLIAPNDLSLKHGSSSSILCRFDAKPSARFTWHFNGKEILNFSNGIKIVDEPAQSRLDIDNITYSNGGTYHCQANHKLLLEPLKSDQISLEVFGKPWLAYPMIPQSVPVGYNASFVCRVYGVPPPDVVWTFLPSSNLQQEVTLKPSPTSSSSVSFDNSVISVDKNGSTLAIVSAGDDTVGNYTCQWSNTHGYVTDSASLIVSDPPITPFITETSEDTKAVSEGEDLELNCSGSGNPTPTVEWELPTGERVKRDAFDDDIQYYSNNNPTISSSGSLIVRNVQRENEGNYKCVLTNNEGSADTTIAVSIFFKPDVTISLDNYVVDEGSRIEIRCQVKANPPASLSWYYPWLDDDSDTSQSSSSPISQSFDGNNGTLLIEVVSQSHQGAYKCIASNDVGSSEAIAFVSVRGPPILVQAPSSLGLVEDESLELTCQVSGYPIPEVTWYHLNLPDPSMEAVNMTQVMQYALLGKGNWTRDPIVDLNINPTEGVVIEDDSLVKLRVTASDGGLYMCHVENSYGSKRAPVIVRVVTFPKFEIKPEDRKALPGDHVVFNCLSTGIPIPTQRWLFNNKQLDTDSRFTVYDNGTLVINSITDADFGKYSCMSTNQYGQRYATAKLLMSGKPVFETEPRSSTFIEFQRGMLHCGGKSILPFMTSWFLKDIVSGGDILLGKVSNNEDSPNVNMNNSSRISVLNNGSLTFSCIELNDESSYFCQLQNEDGLTVSDSIRLNVNSSPRDINIKMPSNSAAGDNIEIECDVRSPLPSSISWITPKANEINASSSNYPGVELLTKTDSDNADNSKSVLSIGNLSNENHGGDWYCKVCNTIGCSMVRSVLIVEDKPVISSIVASVSGDDIAFQCLAVGIPVVNIKFLTSGSYIIAESLEGHNVINNTLFVKRTHVKKEYTCEAVNSIGSSRISISKPPVMNIRGAVPYSKSITIETEAEFPFVHLLPSRLFLDYKTETEEEWKTYSYTISGKFTSYIDVFRFSKLEGNRKNCSDLIPEEVGETQHFENLRISVISDGQNFNYHFNFDVNSLLPYRKYSIRIALGNYLASGPYSETLQVVTLSAAPPSVEDIVITVFNRSAWVSWSYPSHLNGRIEDVVIQVDILKAFNGSLIRRKTQSAANDPSLTFDNLDVSDYRLEIISKNQVLNESSDIISQAFVVEEEVPSFVPEIVQIKSLAFHRVTITWTVPKGNGHMIPPVTGYSLVITLKTEPNSTIKVDIDGVKTSIFTVTNLKERHEYTARIASKNDVGDGLYSLSRVFITAYAPFSTLPLGTTDLSGTSWKLIGIGIVSALLAMGIVAILVAISIQIKMNKRGSAEITTESHDGKSDPDDLTTSDLEGVMNSNYMLY